MCEERRCVSRFQLVTLDTRRQTRPTLLQCNWAHVLNGRCTGQSHWQLLPLTGGPQQWRHCSSGTKACEAVCPHVHLLPDAANSLGQGKKNGGWLIFLNGRVGPSVLTWNGQNRKFKVNVNSWWVNGIYHHIFFLSSWVNKRCSADWRSEYAHMLTSNARVFLRRRERVQQPCSCGLEAGSVCRISVNVCVYLSGCDGPSMQQGQQTAEGRGADGGGSMARAPHQVGEQDVAQELLWLSSEVPGRRTRVKIWPSGSRDRHSVALRRRLLLLTTCHSAHCEDCWESKAAAIIYSFSHSSSNQEAISAMSESPPFPCWLMPLTPNSTSFGGSVRSLSRCSSTIRHDVWRAVMFQCQ